MSRDGTSRDVREAEVAIVGGGGAGSSLVLALDHAVRRTGLRPPSLVVVDPVRRSGQDRTWCWWGAAGTGPDWIEPLLTRTWPAMRLVDADGAGVDYDLAPLRYQMLASADLYRAAQAALDRLGGTRIVAAAERIEDGPQHAVVTAGGRSLRADWVLDSRPGPPTAPGSTSMLQHFRGWTVDFDSSAAVLDENIATLMDFTVPQPERGVAFAYCLPLSARRALVEYTEFSPAVLEPAAYQAALRAYLSRTWPDARYTVSATEDGVIPMTDARFPRRTGRRVFRLGTAGGATRGSTGYTFAAMQRQASAVADLLLARRIPLPPRPYPRRHRWMDAVLLRALDRGYVDGTRLFTRLFADRPSGEVIGFLDGASTPAQELAIMAATPVPAMTRAALEDLAGRSAALPGRLRRVSADHLM